MIISFTLQKLFSLMQSHLFFFFFFCLWRQIKTNKQISSVSQISVKLLPLFFLQGMKWSQVLHFIVLPSRPLICSASSIMMLNPYNIFFSSILNCYFLIFSVSLLKLSFCSSILFPSFASIFITNTLNTVSCTLLISISFTSFAEVFVLFFWLECIPLSPLFA